MRLAPLLDVVRERGARYVVFDSLSYSNLAAEDLARLQRELDVGVIFILHERKDGGARGPSSLLHYPDITLRLEAGGRFALEKSRFADLREGTLPWLSTEEVTS